MNLTELFKDLQSNQFNPKDKKKNNSDMKPLTIDNVPDQL